MGVENSIRIIPGWHQLEEMHNPLTEGEMALVRYLDNWLPRDESWSVGDDLENYHGWLIFAQPYLNGTRPDVIVFNPFVGMVIFEVKDWDPACYRLDDGKKQLFVRTASGEEHTVKRPQHQVGHYKEVILGQLVPLLGEAVDANEKNFGLIKTAVYFHNASTAECRRVFAFENEKGTVLFGRNELQDGKTLKVIVPDAGIRTSKFWDRKWSNEVLFWLRPPQHSIEQGAVLTLRGNQVKVAEPKTGHYRVRGVAGSGKTQMLAYRAAKLASEGKRVLILTFNITLWHYIHDMIARAPFNFSWAQIRFDHFHGFCSNVLNELGEEWPKGDGDGAFFESVIPSVVEDAVVRHGGYERYDAILIDEGQDYVYNWYRMLTVCFLSSRDEVLVVCDKRQNIYERDLSWLDKRVTRHGLEKFGDYIDLSVSIRQPPKLAAFSKSFADAYDIKNDIVQKLEPVDELVSTESIRWIEMGFRETLEETVYRQFLALKEQKISPSDVVILLPSHKIGLSVMSRFRQSNIEINHVFDDEDSHGKNHKRAFWMGDSRVKMCTIHSFKGWELQNVILVTPIDADEFDGPAKPNVDRLVYTALTRVKRNVVVLNRNARYRRFGAKYSCEMNMACSTRTGTEDRMHCLTLEQGKTSVLPTPSGRLNMAPVIDFGISPDTQAVLLLCGALGRNDRDLPPLTPGQYNVLATALNAIGKRPGDLIGASGPNDVLISEACAVPNANGRVKSAGPDRIAALLRRGVTLSTALDKWAAYGVRVISRADESYPARLRKHLGAKAPALIYYAGNAALLSGGGMAFVGARDITEEATEMLRSVVRGCVDLGMNVVSGGARGADQTAMQEAFSVGGKVIGALPCDLLKACLDPSNRDALAGGNALLFSAFDPEVRPFSYGQVAMDRNKYIYGMADACFVAQSGKGTKSGTWSGADEELKSKNRNPIYVYLGENPSEGCVDLAKRGAIAWDPVRTVADNLSAHAMTESSTTLSQKDMFCGFIG